MDLDGDLSPDPSCEGRDWDPAGLGEGPDAVDLVVEVATMMSVFAAQQLVRVDVLRREALVEAVARGVGVLDVVERSVRLSA